MHLLQLAAQRATATLLDTLEFEARLPVAKEIWGRSVSTWGLKSNLRVVGLGLPKTLSKR